MYRAKLGQNVYIILCVHKVVLHTYNKRTKYIGK